MRITLKSRQHTLKCRHLTRKSMYITMMQVRGGARSARLELPWARARLDGYRRKNFWPGPGPHPIAPRDQMAVSV